MRRLIAFLMVLLMPIILITSGGAVIGLGVNNDWDIVITAGFAMIGVGILWGIGLFLWGSNGSL